MSAERDLAIARFAAAWAYHYAYEEARDGTPELKEWALAEDNVAWVLEKVDRQLGKVRVVHTTIEKVTTGGDARVRDSGAGDSGPRANVTAGVSGPTQPSVLGAQQTEPPLPRITGWAERCEREMLAEPPLSIGETGSNLLSADSRVASAGGVAESTAASPHPLTPRAAMIAAVRAGIARGLHVGRWWEVSDDECLALVPEAARRVLLGPEGKILRTAAEISQSIEQSVHYAAGKAEAYAKAAAIARAAPSTYVHQRDWIDRTETIRAIEASAREEQP